MIKTLTNRALKTSSTWQHFDREITRLKQVFSNNEYPQYCIVEKTINNILNKYNDIPPEPPPDDIKLYVALDNVSTFNSDEKTLKAIVNCHVKSTNSEQSVQTIAYYKPRKIKSLFTTRPRIAYPDKSHVVYQFSCTESGCNATYVGYTTNRLITRCKQHRYSSSSIHNQYSFDHDILPPPQTY